MANAVMFVQLVPYEQEIHDEIDIHLKSQTDDLSDTRDTIM